MAKTRAGKGKPWSKSVEEAGVSVRIYERTPGGMLQLEARTDGRKTRESLRTRDRGWAEGYAREVARGLYDRTRAGVSMGPLTLGQLFTLYRRERFSLLKPDRKGKMERVMDLFLRHLTEDFPVEDFTQHTADTYLAARRSGRLVPGDRRAVKRPRNGTLRNEMQDFSAICSLGRTFRIKGKRLLQHNPMGDVRLPREANPARPVAGAEEYAALMAVADGTDPSGQLRAMLALAHYMGRRINAICHLRRSDLLLSNADVRAALAAAGIGDPGMGRWARAIRWPAEWDKEDNLEFAALASPALLEEVKRYLDRYPCVGDAWLFPHGTVAGDPNTPGAMLERLKKAKRAAGVPHVYRSGFHSYRRGWGDLRKGLSPTDVAAAGGWKDLSVMQGSYQQADADTIWRVMEYAG